MTDGGLFSRNFADDTPDALPHPMRPRPVIQGRTYMFTRRCSERRFFLRPDDETNNTFWYCLGWAAQKHGMVLHAAVALSNHVHICATDRRGVYPDFLRDFHGLLARAMNALRGRWEYFWDANQASVVLLEDDAAQLDKLVYVLANPLALVKKATQWPGATSVHTLASGASTTATIPKYFFRDDKAGGAMPPSVSINFQPPPALAHLSRGQYAATVSDLVSIAATNRRKNSIPVLGPEKILAQHWNDSPSTPEPRRQMSPTVACRDKRRRIECLQLNKAFQTVHRHAFDAFRNGLKAIFPFGTWAMRFRAAVVISTA